MAHFLNNARNHKSLDKKMTLRLNLFVCTFLGYMHVWDNHQQTTLANWIRKYLNLCLSLKTTTVAERAQRTAT